MAARDASATRRGRRAGRPGTAGGGGGGGGGGSFLVKQGGARGVPTAEGASQPPSSSAGATAEEADGVLGADMEPDGPRPRAETCADRGRIESREHPQGTPNPSPVVLATPCSERARLPHPLPPISPLAACGCRYHLPAGRKKKGQPPPAWKRPERPPTAAHATFGPRAPHAARQPAAKGEGARHPDLPVEAVPERRAGTAGGTAAGAAGAGAATAASGAAQAGDGPPPRTPTRTSADAARRRAKVRRALLASLQAVGARQAADAADAAVRERRREAARVERSQAVRGSVQEREAAMEWSAQREAQRQQAAAEVAGRRHASGLRTRRQLEGLEVR